MSQNISNKQNALRYFAALVVFFVVWWFLSFFTPAFVLPKPHLVVVEIANNFSAFAKDALFTAGNALAGAIFGIVGGVACAIALVAMPRLRWLTEPYLWVAQSFPLQALGWWFAIILGFGTPTNIASAAVLSFFPICAVTLSALLNTPPQLLKLVKSWGMSDLQVLWHCRLPHAAPSILGGGAKIAVPLALVGSVLGEFIGGPSRGLGHVQMAAGATFRVDRIMSSLLLLGIVGVAFTAGVNLLQNTVFRKFQTN